MAMRDAYARVLRADSSCVDCYLGLGIYQYGLARASLLARLVAKIIGLGSGSAERGVAYLRRVAQDGDLARVEATWVLAAALAREAARDPGGRATLEREARTYRSEEHTSELQSRLHLVCRLLLGKKKNKHKDKE